jgi:general secretion pathway protein G
MIPKLQIKKHQAPNSRKRSLKLFLLEFGISQLVLPQSGFTLIEILVVATIMGLLASVGFTGYQSVTRSGRDALRKTNLEQIRSALEVYKSENTTYPTYTNGYPDNFSGYINLYPNDPKPSEYRYVYVPLAGSTSYLLCAHMENGGSNNPCAGPGAISCSLGGTGDCNYVVTNP